ncbi:MAG: nitrile hydratase subunit alpha [Candidatus Eremiobacteraeota bacterium]|nr:nitrile hydratase subunit alpha [Candidatus Eremiobacteraeota bacterium]
MSHDHEGSAAVSNRVKLLVTALQERSVLTEAQLDDTVEKLLLHSKPANAFAMVARSWVDAAYKARLLADANAAAAELGIDLSHWSPVKLRAVENTPVSHKVIVCTLCSCYPIALLGPSPTWYKSEAYRSRVVRDPRSVLAEFGVSLPDEKEITVWDSTAEVRYLVIPQRPAATENATEAQLAAMITRNGLIGTALL